MGPELAQRGPRVGPGRGLNNQDLFVNNFNAMTLLKEVRSSVLERIEKTAFAENLKTKFRASLGGPEGVELELTSIRDGVSTPRQEQFALIFRGPGDFYLPQQTYQMEHEQMGTFDLLLVPIAQDADGFTYEAVFNRLLP